MLKKNWLLVIVLGFSLLPVCHGVPSVQDAGKIVAIVNDRVISKADLEYRLQLVFLSSGLPDNLETRQKIKDQVFQSMLHEAVQLSVAKKYDIKITDPEVLEAFRDFENRNEMQPDELKKLLESHKIPLDVFYQQIRATLSWNAYIQGRFQGVVQVNDTEIDQFIKDLEAKKDKPHMLVSEISLRFDVFQKEMDEHGVLKKAEELFKNLKEGGSFAALAQQFSHSATAARGGSMGWVVAEDLDPDFVRALKDIQPGQVTAPIKTRTGYTLLFLKDVRAAGESVHKDTLLSFLQVLYPASKPFSDQKLAPVFENAQRMSRGVRGCGALMQLTKGVSTLQSHKVDKAPVSELPPQLKDLLLKLTIGVPTDPILTDMGFMVFMVCEKEEIDPGNPSEKEVRAQLLSRKLQQLSMRELQKELRIAHIDLREKGASL